MTTSTCLPAVRVRPRHPGTGLVQGLARFITSPRGAFVLDTATRCLYNDALRAPMLRMAQRWAVSAIRSDSAPRSWQRIQHERAMLAVAAMDSAGRLIGQRFLARSIVKRVLQLWGRAFSISPEQHPAYVRFAHENGCQPPWFLVIAPGRACNLRCAGCYADADSGSCALPWDIFDRLISEARELWGVPLIVLSGGEPLLYRSEGRGVLDAVERHPDCLFLMFTNGTLIDESVAQRLARLGNLTPAISVEGLQTDTDRRRGAGAFERVLRAMHNLRQVGLPFGVSVTATRSNCDQILSDPFLDFFFLQQGALYGFLFHYMPIGRCPTLGLMPTPQQRMQLLRRTWQVISERKLFWFDFWNSGPLVEGCISAGREGGYLYVDWSAKVMPCVFAPYSVANLRDVYSRDGTLEDVWRLPMLQAIRQWQRDYGFGRAEPSRDGNWLRPCPVRDHHATFRAWLERYGPEPEDESAQHILQDAAYLEGLVAYGEDVAQSSQDIWERDYLGQGAP